MLRANWRENERTFLGASWKMFGMKINHFFRNLQCAFPIVIESHWAMIFSKLRCKSKSLNERKISYNWNLVFIFLKKNVSIKIVNWINKAFIIYFQQFSNLRRRCEHETFVELFKHLKCPLNVNKVPYRIFFSHLVSLIVCEKNGM